MSKQMGLVKVSLLIVVMLVCISQAIGQVILKDAAAEMGIDWVAGRWQATTDDGDKINLVYRWDLEGYACVMSFKMGDMMYRGLIYYKASEDKVVEYGIDTEGNTFKSEWDMADGKLVSKRERTNSWGEKQNMAIAHSKVDAKTMKVEVYGVEDGELSDYPMAELVFKRLPPPKKKAAAAKKANTDAAK